MVGRFLTIKQETTMEEYRHWFVKLLAPIAFLQTIVLEETFMNGFIPWLKTEVPLNPVELAQMMKLASKIKNRELVRSECGLSSAYGGKPQFNLPNAKNTTTVATNKTQPVGN